MFFRSFRIHQRTRTGCSEATGNFPTTAGSHIYPDLVEQLTETQALNLRQRALLLRDHSFTDPAGVVEWFGAMQAQDVASGHWSFGTRLPHLSDTDVDKATHDRQIIRTWPMRGTIHFVPPKDVTWMLELTGSLALKGVAKRWEQLGIDEHQIDTARRALIDALTDDELLTRSQCLEVLSSAGLETSGQRGYHYLWHGAQTGAIVIGPQIDKQQTFASAERWLPSQVKLNRNEALQTLARRFFRSHGPATRKDFAGWTSLLAADTKAALAALGSELTDVIVNDTLMHCPTALLEQLPATEPTKHPEPYLNILPGFDEYLLGYKTRTLMADSDVMAAVIPGGNGVFRSTVVIDGAVKATWKRTMNTRSIAIRVQPLGGWMPTTGEVQRLNSAFDGYGDFYSLPVKVLFE